MNGYNFTEEVRRVLAASRVEALALRHEYVGTEHVLLGIVACAPCVATDVMRTLNTDLEAVRAQILAGVRPGAGDRQMTDDLPFTSRTKKVLELAMSEARDLQHSYVGSEHLLLGLIREEQGIAAQALAHLGLSLEGATREVLRHTGAPSLRETPAPAAASPSTQVAGSPASRGSAGRSRRATYAALSAGIVALGVVHTLTTFRLFPALTPSALWFASTGLLLILAGALNFLNLAYGSAARGVRRTTVTTNVVLMAFAAKAGLVGGASWGELVLVVGLLGGTTVLSLHPDSRVP